MSERFAVYFNLRKDTFSVRWENVGRVVAHRNCVVLRDCTFVVQPAGQRKVRETGVKNVHAWVKGSWQDRWRDLLDLDLSRATPIMYNPFTCDTFVTQDTREPVHRAAQVLCQIRVDHKPQLFAWGIEQNKESAHAAQQG